MPLTWLPHIGTCRSSSEAYVSSWARLQRAKRSRVSSLRVVPRWRMRHTAVRRLPLRLTRPKVAWPASGTHFKRMGWHEPIARLAWTYVRGLPRRLRRIVSMGLSYACRLRGSPQRMLAAASGTLCDKAGSSCVRQRACSSATGRWCSPIQMRALCCVHKTLLHRDW